MRINLWERKYLAICLLIVWFFGYIPIVRAGGLTDISTILGDYRPSNTTNFTIDFKIASTSNLKRINFAFVRASDNWNKPPTQDVTNATLDAVTGLNPSNWAIEKSGAINGSLFLRYLDGEDVNAETSISVAFGNIHKAELGDCTISEMIYDKCWIQISTYSDDGTTLVDSGGVEYQIEDVPSLTFNIDGVAENSTHNGITTTGTSTYDQINFGSIRINQPVFMAHKLSVRTTAPHGYLVTMKLNGYIQGLEPNNQITPFLPINGAWTSPQIWESPEGSTNSGSGWVGANTSDSRVDQYLGMTNIWSAGNGAGKFGPVSSTVHAVMYSSARDRDGTEVYVTYGIEASEKQPPDAYAGTIQYNILATY